MIPINTLLQAYRSGFFPMAVRGRIGWYSPNARGVLPLDQFHVPRRLRRVLRQDRFRFTVDRDFRTVITSCASRLADAGNWIDAEIIDSYCALHDAGYGHSVEVWRNGELAGGLYGVAMGAAFFGESMFCTESDASKAALCALVDRLRAREFLLLDTQWLTPHLEQFGAIEIPRGTYLRMLAEAVGLRRSFIASDQSNRGRSSA